MGFEPDYKNILDAALNNRPSRLPVYEHIISPAIMEKILNTSFAGLEQSSNADDIKNFFHEYCRFFKEMTYDTVSYEICITPYLPGHGALMGGMKGPIQSRADFNSYPWDDIIAAYWKYAAPRFDALASQMPRGMKAIGGIGNGVFEISEDLVGLEQLAYMQADDPQLFADVYQKIGDLMMAIWTRFLSRYADLYVVCRFGDDLGFRSGTLTSPANIHNFIIPQYRRIIKLIKSHNKPFLWHSCGCVFDIMEAVIQIGINAKHSNEDAIAPFDRWIKMYSDRIGLFGGFDVDLICRDDAADITKQIVESGARYRKSANGYALGSGNSIPDYVPVDGYLAMIEAAKKIRAGEPV